MTPPAQIPTRQRKNVAIDDIPFGYQQCWQGETKGCGLAYAAAVVVRIVKKSTDRVDGVPLGRYQVGETYDLTPALAGYLVAQGSAVVEMRRTQRSGRARDHERRRSPQINRFKLK